MRVLLDGFDTQGCLHQLESYSAIFYYDTIESYSSKVSEFDLISDATQLETLFCYLSPALSFL